MKLNTVQSDIATRLEFCVKRNGCIAKHDTNRTIFHGNIYHKTCMENKGGDKKNDGKV